MSYTPDRTISWAGPTSPEARSARRWWPPRRASVTERAHQSWQVSLGRCRTASLR